MTDEEKKAIEYVKEFIEELQCDINMFGFEDDCEEEQNLLVDKRDNFKIILNLVKKLTEDIENINIYRQCCLEKLKDYYKESIDLNNRVIFLKSELEAKDKEIEFKNITIKQLKLNLEKIHLKYKNDSERMIEEYERELKNLNESCKVELEKKDKIIESLEKTKNVCNIKLIDYIFKRKR